MATRHRVMLLPGGDFRRARVRGVASSAGRPRIRKWSWRDSLQTRRRRFANCSRSSPPD